MRIPMMVPVKKERRHFVSIGNVLTILGMIGAVTGVGWTLSGETADLKRRVTTLEQRNDETRREIKDVTHEIKTDVKDTKDAVQLILRTLDSMQAVDRERNLERIRQETARRRQEGR